MTPSRIPREVAVIGSGVAGLTAAYVLARHDIVTLYEADDRLGGHAHTHRVPQFGGRELAVDSGFIVHNDRTYPTLLRLFGELGVATQESDMSMSVRSDRDGVEYAGAKGAAGLFPSLRMLTTGRHWRMLAEVKRFHRAATDLLDTPDEGPAVTIAEFVEAHGFSDYFVDNFMTPLVAAVWSCEASIAGRYPARYLFTFLQHHGMLTVFGSPTWRTVTGGSVQYVDRVAAHIDEVRVSCPVLRLDRDADGIRVVDGTGQERRYDAAVLAVHPHQALRLLGEPTRAESDVLGAIPYTTNHAQLHTDTSVLPNSRRAWASWNYLIPEDSTAAEDVLVSYDLTRLMRLPEPDGRRYLVTLGGRDRIDPATVVAEMTYEHPVYTPESVAARARLAELGSSRFAFAGAYHGWGFHEDGALSGLRAAERIGGSWDDPATNFQRNVVGEVARR